MRGNRAAFGAICWTPSANIDEAIHMVRAFEDCEQAIDLASTSCRTGERWAVVELASMTVVAEGGGVNSHLPR